ncbi:hypothetical protein NEAUS04_1444 [Nematocida ausubeli]|uniref:Uncharacterized protein n=1 Tax=Nematocida ausubeli (strain ATCC PRA-371 / ERTm2) TaxID=1913371 RepID=A0A086J293_NEMA1|nr:uncharacterized protein NESG_01380 [Nematocida ausubeli]KAI5132541.1 hypothetical protein NEAUS06_0190 [Nematocida ausubeli]KAI5136293.1 hypothetical protein NEAUS07_1564 [Nematocida ausubeli]KAI5149172.1 hypothetical protein NEAUS05_1668 [Nematocida ausubeli]KAI5163237.1 hypothetical protein NEAUS04_1444 [Nematocida ausubeli]KFG26261.1 hypothetical protein NESG_01380 [Nematocida ausubeli]
MKWKEDYSYIQNLYKELLDNEEISTDIIYRKINRLESQIRKKTDIIIRQLSILQREEKELEDILERSMH